MALKQKINKETYDALPDAVKAEYKLQGMDYVLDVEGYEDPAELKRAKDREAEERKKEKARADKAEADLAAANEKLNDGTTANARKQGDIATLEASWKAKEQAAIDAGKAATEKLQAQMRNLLVNGTAKQLAAALSKTPNVLMPHIMTRLEANFEGDEPTIRVLDATGKPSALTVEDLSKEFLANEEFSGIITASSASGGGAPGGKQGGGGATKKFADMTGSERAKLKETDPARYEKEASAVQAASSVKL